MLKQRWEVEQRLCINTFVSEANYFIAVSYTHLLKEKAPEIKQGLELENMYEIGYRQLDCYKPVSYTHLDCWKILLKCKKCGKLRKRIV